MLIINKYRVTTPAPVVATNNNNVNTGITSDTWGGINPVATTGATGNAVTGSGLTAIVNNGTYESQIITKIIQLEFTGTLTAANANYVKLPLAQIGINGSRKVIGATMLGIYNSTSTETGNTPTTSLITVIPDVTVTLSILKDQLVFEIVNGSQALYQNKIASILLYYHQ